VVVVGPIFLGLSCIDGDTSHVGIWTSARLINYLFLCSCTILGGVDAGDNIPTHDLENDDRQSQEHGYDGRRSIGRYFAVYAWTIVHDKARREKALEFVGCTPPRLKFH